MKFMIGDNRGMRLMIRRLVRVVEVVLPVVVGLFYVAVVLEFLENDAAAATGASLFLAVVQGTSLAWRRERPELVAALVIVAGLPFHLLVPELVLPIAGMVAIWSLALTRPPRVSLIGLTGLLGLASINFFTTTLEDTVFTIAVAVSVWALAEGTRNRRAAIRESVRRAVSEEQARIARELHDVIAHTVSVMVVQAGAAGDVFDASPEQARTALSSIEEAGRDALGELRRLLGAVRPDAISTPAPPQPGLAHLDDLTEPLRAAGLKVVVTREGTPMVLPPGVDVSAYRIVQEALTNTLRHARATLAEVTFRYGPDAIEIDVVDDGRGAPGGSGDGPGFGLIGMRERAALLGGILEVGPTSHGGYRVHARLPLDRAP